MMFNLFAQDLISEITAGKRDERDQKNPNLFVDRNVRPCKE